MKTRSLVVLIAALALGLAFFGCEGEEGPAGPQGPEGPQGPPGDEETPYTYLGNGGEDCMHCHSTTVMHWGGTKHSGAYDSLVEEGPMVAQEVENLYCLQCHTTGWDSPVNYGDTEISEYGPDEYGYDDYVGVDTEEAAHRREALEGVQCESCHGPMGPEFNAHAPEMSFSTRFEGEESTSLCAPCHSTQLEEWVESGHGTVADANIEDFNDEHYAHIGSCQGCHTSEGFIRENDPAYATYDFGEMVSFIGCVTCHDPHAGTYESQVRTTGLVEVEYHPGYEDGDPEVASMSGYGAAQVCAKCHHARRDNENVAGQIAEGYGHFGPHSSPQMDMFLGAGSYEIADYDYERGHVHQGIEQGCVECHMRRDAEIHGDIEEHAFHTFQPTGENCQPCHNINDFDYNGVQTEIMGLMDDLAVALGYADYMDFDTNFDSQADGVQVWEREAAYALAFVASDGSYGVHNPSYARDLLNNAIAYANAQ